MKTNKSNSPKLDNNRHSYLPNDQISDDNQISKIDPMNQYKAK